MNVLHCKFIDDTVVVTVFKNVLKLKQGHLSNIKFRVNCKGCIGVAGICCVHTNMPVLILRNMKMVSMSVKMTYEKKVATSHDSVWGDILENRK